MTREEFINILDGNRYLYEIKGGRILVISIYDKNVTLEIDSLPSGVEFKNKGSVVINRLKELPDDVVFNNEGAVAIEDLESIHKGVKFFNDGNVELWGLKSIPSNMEFHNKGLVYTAGPNPFNWADSVDIEGISFGRLFNLMIKKGIFER